MTVSMRAETHARLVALRGKGETFEDVLSRMCSEAEVRAWQEAAHKKRFYAYLLHHPAKPNYDRALCFECIGTSSLPRDVVEMVEHFGDAVDGSGWEYTRRPAVAFTSSTRCEHCHRLIAVVRGKTRSI